MIGGGVALAVWAVPRMTHDLDIVVDLPENRISEFSSHFTPNRYYIDPEMMLDAFQHREQPSLGMYSFTDLHTGGKVDLFPLRPTDPAQQAALTRRVVIEILEGFAAAVYTPEDLLIQKLRWYAATGSERQFRDCINLILTDLKRPSPMISVDYVSRWVENLGADVQQAWSDLRSATSIANSEGAGNTQEQGTP